MLRPALLVLVHGASAACGFAALGLSLYAGADAAVPAARLFGGIGWGAGLLCGGLQLALGGMPARRAPPMPAPAVAELVRATLATAAAQRAARTGTVADRRPAPGEAPSARPAAVPDTPRFASSAFGA